MNIRTTRRFGLRGIFLSSALVMFSGATTAAEIEICSPSGTPALTCEVLSLATPVALTVDGASANWDAVFENGQFLQLPAIVESLTLSLGFGTNDVSGDAFFDFFGVAEFYLTDASGIEITADLTPGTIEIPGVGTAGSNGFSRTWTGTGLQGLAIYDFHVRCDDCIATALDLEVELQAYSFTMITNSPDEANGFTIGPAAAVPAPASLALLGLGLIAVGGWSRRRHAA